MLQLSEVVTRCSTLWTCANPRARIELVEQVRRDIGPIDILVNNAAGVEFTSEYHNLRMRFVKCST
jgi:hypothetical protein